MPEDVINDGQKWEEEQSSSLIDDWEIEPPKEEPAPEETTFVPIFDPKWQTAFEGLAYVGHLEATVTIPYHSFTVRTLTVGEKIKIAEMIKHLEDSLGYARAYRAAVAAAGVVTVDGQPLLVGSRNIDAITQKFKYMIDNWHDFVIDTLYEKINELEGQVLQVLEELGIFSRPQTVAQVGSAQIARFDGLDNK